MIQPIGNPGDYQTYALTVPRQTHQVVVSCVRAGCEAMQLGWTTLVDEATDLGQRQATYIRGDRTRRHVETRAPGGLTSFTFEPGQECFAEHTEIVREPNYLIRGGDRRGNPRGEPTRVLTAEQWRDDFGEHQDRLADEQRRG